MLPVSEPYITEREINLVNDAVSSGWISSAGKYINKFQNDFAKYHNVKSCIALSNGTAALEVALHAIGIEKGDEIIIPSFTIISLPLAILRLGAIPRLIDVDIDTWNINAKKLEKVINKRTKAIIVVHGFGHPADIDPIIKLARTNNIKIVEDTAEAIGSRYKGRLCGTMGDIGSFSFYANKLITTGEGGCIITNNDEYANKAKRYINLYFGLKERFSHDEIGYNFRMTNMQAALGVAQMEKIEFFKKRKKRSQNGINKNLKIAQLLIFRRLLGMLNMFFGCILLF